MWNLSSQHCIMEIKWAVRVHRTVEMSIARFLGFSCVLDFAEGKIMPELISASALSEMIGSIYDCALDPERWPATLTSLRHMLGFHNAALTLVGLPAGEVLLTVTSGIEPSWLERIPLYGADIVEEWGGADSIHSIPFEEPAV